MKRFAILIFLLFGGCFPKGGDDPSTFDCSTGNPVYDLIMGHHSEWMNTFYEQGSSFPARYTIPLGSSYVYLVGPSGNPAELAINYDNWDNVDKMILVGIAQDNEFDGAYFGLGGSFGFIYSETLDPAPILYQYTITSLTDTVYCYVIKPEYIQEGN